MVLVCQIMDDLPNLPNFPPAKLSAIQYHIKSKIHCQFKNTSGNNYIPELLTADSVVVDGEFLLEWCEYFGQPQVWYIECL